MPQIWAASRKFWRAEKRKKLHASGGRRRSDENREMGAIRAKKSNFASENGAYGHFSRVRDDENGNFVGTP
jgi:hypothetical protein